MEFWRGNHSCCCFFDLVCITIFSEHPVFGSVQVLVPHLTNENIISNCDTKSSYEVATGMSCVQNNQFEIMSSPGVIYSSIGEQTPLPNQRNVCALDKWDLTAVRRSKIFNCLRKTKDLIFTFMAQDAFRCSWPVRFGGYWMTSSAVVFQWNILIGFHLAYRPRNNPRE